LSEQQTSLISNHITTDYDNNTKDKIDILCKNQLGINAYNNKDKNNEKTLVYTQKEKDFKHNINDINFLKEKDSKQIDCNKLKYKQLDSLDSYNKKILNLSDISSKNNETFSIYFKDDLKNKFNQTNSIISYTSENSSKQFENPKGYFKQHSKLEKFDKREYPFSNSLHEVNISNEDLDDSMRTNSKYFYDEISTKTLNTCSIRDDDFEEDDDKIYL